MPVKIRKVENNNYTQIAATNYGHNLHINLNTQHDLWS